MERLNTLQGWLQAHGYGVMTACHPVAGGSLNDTSIIDLSHGATLFLKQQRSAPEGFFRAEAAGLTALATATTLRVPRVIQADAEWLLLEDLGVGTPRPDHWTRLGEGLAQVHARPHPRFGFSCDTFCGLTRQDNTPTDDGYAFLGSQRLLALGRQAAVRHQLDRGDMRALEYIAGHLDQWLPPTLPVLVHGDLWSGNVHCAGSGEPALIDPACHWGWAEGDLAMTLLFGGFPPAFYAAYAAATDLDPDWRERTALHQLYHLLNHMLLFGVSYLSRVRAVLNRYAPR